MAIKKWYLDADTSITNAYQDNLSTRGTGSNSGASDALEIFSIYGQAEATGAAASELSRIVMHFSASQIWQAVDDAELPATGATNAPRYFLRMSNCPHAFTLPKNYNLEVHELTATFTEGTGLDMENYRDDGAASWLYRNDTPGATATGSILVGTNPTPPNTFIVRVDGTEVTCTAQAAGGGDTAIVNTAEHIAAQLNGNATIAAKITASTGGGAAAGEVVLQADAAGKAGNYSYSLTTPADGSVTAAGNLMTGGLDFTTWTTAGGDFTAGVLTTTDRGSGTNCQQTFTTGEEDLIIDITDDVNTWIAAGIASNAAAADAAHPGYMLKLPAATETLATSFYTKKFFARSSEFFYKRPCIEARWNDTVLDDRAKVYAGHSFFTNAQNSQSLYLYNSIGGSTANFTLASPGGGGNESVYVKFYRDVDLLDLASFTTSAGAAATEITATNPKTGAYAAGVILNETGSLIYEKWYIATATDVNTPANWTIIHTGSFALKQRTFNEDKTNRDYILDITNLKNSYSRSEIARFRLYTRLKDWSPTIYSVASKALENEIVEQAYYKIFRVVDEETVIDYGIGTTGTNWEHTKLSYDASGSYFDLDMSLLEAGYMYGIKVMFIIDSEKKEQPEVFKFRVD